MSMETRKGELPAGRISKLTASASAEYHQLSAEQKQEYIDAGKDATFVHAAGGCAFGMPEREESVAIAKDAEEADREISF